MPETVIQSLQNPKVKRVLLLQQKSSERRREGVFIVEGRRELMHCREAGHAVESVFWCAEILSEPFAADAWGGAQCFQVSADVYGRMAYRGSTEGLIAVVRSRDHSLADLDLPDKPLVMVLEQVEKPGNIGAILRSADAAGVDAVIICDPLTDLYNPNLIRASIGSIFTVPTAVCSSEECIRFLKERGIQILTAQLQDSHLYYATDMTLPTALVMGTEATGLTAAWRQAADAHIRIPMLGRLDSLNVSVSAAILMFEAVRQRQTGL